MSTHALKTSNLLEAKHRHSHRTEKQEAGHTLADVLKAEANFVAWLVSLGLGGAMLVLYYSRIHYFPELEWKESFTYLVALSFLGGMVAVLYGLLLFFPGVIWSEFLIHDSKLKDKLCYPVDEGHDEACFRAVALHMALPFLIFMGIVHVVAWFAPFWGITTTAIGTLALISVVLTWLFQKTISETEKGFWKWLREHIRQTAKGIWSWLRELFSKMRKGIRVRRVHHEGRLRLMRRSRTGELRSDPISP